MAGQPRKRKAWQDIVIPQREEILERISNGESLAHIAADIGVKRYWLCDYFEQPTEAIEYARSRTRAATALAESCKDIADTSPPEVGNLMKAKLQIATRQWLARHWDRSRYGEYPQMQSTPLALIHAEVIRKRSAEPAATLQIAGTVPAASQSTSEPVDE